MCDNSEVTETSQFRGQGPSCPYTIESGSKLSHTLVIASFIRRKAGPCSLSIAHVVASRPGPAIALTLPLHNTYILMCEYK